MKVIEFGHLAFNVSDMERAEHFYCDVLGLEKAFPIRIPENMAELMPESPLVELAGKTFIQYIKLGNGSFLELFCPTSATDMESGGPNYDNLGYAHMSLVVDNLAVWEKHLKENGVTVDSEIQMGPDHTYTMWIKDPDGNRIELMQYTPESLQVVHR